MAVTSDTPEYCATLARLALAAPAPPADARRLIAEGQEMCDRGMIRGGIARLRRALLVERHRPHSAPIPATTPPAVTPPPLDATEHPPPR